MHLLTLFSAQGKSALAWRAPTQRVNSPSCPSRGTGLLRLDCRGSLLLRLPSARTPPVCPHTITTSLNLAGPELVVTSFSSAERAELHYF